MVYQGLISLLSLSSDEPHSELTILYEQEWSAIKSALFPLILFRFGVLYQNDTFKKNVHI